MHVPEDGHTVAATFCGKDERGEKWKASCVCGWWMALRTYDATVKAGHAHEASIRRARLFGVHG